MSKYRNKIRTLIGHNSERLVWIFCMVDRLSVDNTLDKYLANINNNNNKPDNNNKNKNSECNNNNIHDATNINTNNTNSSNICFISREELGRFIIPIKDEEEYLDFLQLSLADWLEQGVCICVCVYYI